MSDSEQRAAWKLTARRGRSAIPTNTQNSERSPSKLARLFRPNPLPSSSPPEPSSPETADLSSRRNAVILDVDPEQLRQLRPPSITSSTGSISTSRFSLVLPPSPPPDSLKYSFQPLAGQHDLLSRSGSKRFLSKKFRGPPTRLFSLRRKQRSVSYESALDGEPLDGEEGELIDDEACFIDAFKTRGMDLLRKLPDELSIYILLCLDMPEILSCLRVSRHWNRIASDHQIWRGFYYRAGFSIDARAAQEAQAHAQQIALQSAHQSMGSPSAPSISTPPSSPMARLAYYLPSYPASLRTSRSTTSSNPDGEAHLRRASAASNWSATSFNGNITRTGNLHGLAPLSLDWRMLYKTRLLISSRLSSPSYTPALIKLLGHKDAVYCVEYDASTDTVITGSRDRTICVWSIRGGNTGNKPRLTMTLQGHLASVLCLQFDQTGCLVSGSSDATVIVWDLNAKPHERTKEVLRKHKGGVLDIKMDTKWIVSCSKDTTVCVWDRNTLALRRTLVAHDGPVNAIGIQDDRVASVSGDGKMILWDIISGEKLRMFEGHERGLACVVYKGDMLISGSNDKKIKVWDARTGECVKTLSGHEHLVRSLSFDPGTMQLVSGSYDRSIRVWDVRSGKVLREFPHVHGSHIFDVVFCVSKIISASHDNQVIVMDFATDLDTTLFA
ncbi:hypothetical protein M408DRAFT_329826 [Serendipita vermifera MAFF 305830]|uniref:F-box domain-containing protein n=1 Tax=Serendipita vermifera MAFF 305830 TaxID=933852 RepID=A0A0C2WNU8_SERVB|nr:hypothetical protein M408DRAFT_329826 [Serendipita vermifera MAFF 305830]